MPLLLIPLLMAIPTGALAYKSVVDDTQKAGNNIAVLALAAGGGYLIYKAMKSGKL